MHCVSPCILAFAVKDPAHLLRHVLPHPIMARLPDDADFLEDLWTGAGSFVPGASTRFVCGDHDARGALTWALRIYDGSGALMDCVAWGNDPHGIKRGEHAGDTPVTSQPELTGCRVP